MANKSNTTVTKSEFSIVRKIMELLKLGEVGKLDSFFSRVLKDLGKQVSALKKNIDLAEFNGKNAIEEIEDRLEDARESLAEAYLKVSPEDVATNEAQKAFQSSYLRNIRNHSDAVEALEAELEAAQETMAEKIKEYQDQIDVREADMKAIKSA